MPFRSSLLLAGALTLAGSLSAQQAPLNRPVPPAPPRSDAPGTPINPRQTAVGAPSTPANQAPGAVGATAQSTPLRELNFAEADTDGDKKVTLTEFANYVGNRPANGSTEPLSEEMIERFRQLDQNGDATLTESEAAAPQQSTQQQPAPSVIPPRR
jgi:hypothetical protein